MSEVSDITRWSTRKRAVVIGITVVGAAVAAVVGARLGRGPRRERSAGAEATARIIAAYNDELRSLRKDQRRTVDPAALADLAASERKLRVLTAVGLGGVLHHSGEPELGETIELEIREMLSAFSNSRDVLAEIESPYFQRLARDDPDFTRDLTGLLEFLVRVEEDEIKAKRLELEKLKAQEAAIRKELAPGDGDRE